MFSGQDSDDDLYDDDRINPSASLQGSFLRRRRAQLLPDPLASNEAEDLLSEAETEEIHAEKDFTTPFTNGSTDDVFHIKRSIVAEDAHLMVSLPAAGNNIMLDEISIKPGATMTIQTQDRVPRVLSNSIFTSFTSSAEELVTPALRLSRDKFQQGRIQQSTVYTSTCYVPYPVVSDAAIREQLLGAASLLHYIDSALAWYFSTTVVTSNLNFAQTQIQQIRADIQSSQNSRRKSRQESGQNGPGEAGTSAAPEDVYIGSLGHYCERVLRNLSDPKTRPSQTPEYKSDRHSRSATLHYLQDAMEVPYWKFILGEFSTWYANTSGYTGETAYRALLSVKWQLQVKVAHLGAAIKKNPQLSNIAPIIAGIEARIQVLDDCPDEKLGGLADVEGTVLKYALDMDQRQITPTNSFSISTKISIGSECQQSRNLRHLNAVFVFLIIAFIPFCKGFSLSMQDPNAAGKTSDPDFWYTLGNNIMWTLASVTMILSIKRLPLLSEAYTSMWMFLITGFICAVASVALYPFVNPGWSSLLTFLASVTSTAAVVVIAQGEPHGNQGAKNTAHPKAKKD